MARFSKGKPVFDDSGFQHERTSLAWERTAFSLLACGALLGRYGASDGIWIFAAIGVAIASCGIALVLWSGFNYEELHGVLEAGESPVHPKVTAFIGAFVSFTALSSLLLGIWVAIDRL